MCTCAVAVAAKASAVADSIAALYSECQGAVYVGARVRHDLYINFFRHCLRFLYSFRSDDEYDCIYTTISLSHQQQQEQQQPPNYERTARCVECVCVRVKESEPACFVQWIII